MADNDRLNAFLTQLAEFDPQSLDALTFARQQFGDVFGQGVFSQLFDPLSERAQQANIKPRVQLLGDLLSQANIGETRQFGLDPQQFFRALLESDDDLGVITQGLGARGGQDQILAGFNKFLRERGLPELSGLRTSLQDRLGLLDEPPFDTSNVISEENPLGQSPFARTPTNRFDIQSQGQRVAIGRSRNQIIEQGREALKELQAVPASVLSDEERERRRREIERQTLEARRGRVKSGSGIGVPGGAGSGRGTGINVAVEGQRTGL